MKKPTPPTIAEVTPVTGSQYVILPGSRIARLLTPTVRNGQTFYNLFLDGKYTRTTVDELLEMKPYKK